MIRINQLKLPIGHKEQELYDKAAKTLKISREQILSLVIVKQSVDARKKPEICYIYTIDVKVEHETPVLKKLKNPNILAAKKQSYSFPDGGTEVLKHRPVIIGSGPAGLFCARMLAEQGYRPIVLERGQDVDKRTLAVDRFWKGGPLDIRSNVQFGEGGAGTFSDGKLNTLVKDPLQRNRKVLELFVEAGADSRILYQNKPHIGTDVLCRVVKHMRRQIESWGGEFRFESQVTDFQFEDGKLRSITVNGAEKIDVSVAVLAIGHSARDTFLRLEELKVPMEQKAFAVGLRIQHPQSMINLSQYGLADPGELGAADYKLTHQAKNGRGVYSFCMCPGGYVVNASSEEGRLAVNGMSYQDRAGDNANSALIVMVTPEDFPDNSPLAGVAYQRKLEELAYEYGSGKVPVQLYGDFKAGSNTMELGDVGPAFCGSWAFANLREMLPDYLSQSLIEGVERFGGMIRGFSRPDAVLAGVESRTSSPVRIHRDSSFESEFKGLFPCGEGAGYAGGITSAAMDGIKVAEEIARRYARF